MFSTLHCRSVTSPILRLASRVSAGRSRLEELADPDAARVACRAAGGQDMVGADGLVAVGNGRLFADEQRAVVGQPVEVERRVFHVQFKVFRSIIVADPALPRPRFGRHRRCRWHPTTVPQCPWSAAPRVASRLPR